MQIIAEQLDNLDTFITKFGDAVELRNSCAITRNREGDALDAVRKSKSEADIRIAETYFNDFENKLIAWQRIAGREGGMTLWETFHTLTAIRSNVNHCQSLKTLLNTGLSKVIEDFAKRFPWRKKIRHAVAHPADLARTLANVEKNAYQGSYSAHGVELRSNNAQITMTIVNGSTFVYTIDHEIVEYDLTMETLESLRKFQDDFHQCFYAAAAHLGGQEK